MQHYRMRPDDIRTELVFLKTGKVKPYAFFWEQLNNLDFNPVEFDGFKNRLAIITVTTP